MKHYFIFMAVILGMIALSASAQDATLRPAIYNASTSNVKKKVAVYVTGDVENGYKKVIGSKLVTGITRSDDYTAVERTADFLAELAKEHDYQTSGAVSDNQIARLGVQFGVRYVLVADVSEIFESMFISARMIDVQTGQITGASEANNEVSNIEGLISLSDNVISDLLGGIAYGEYRTNNHIEDIKVIGPFSYRELHTYYQKVPEGYHVASKDEVEKLIQIYRKANKSIAFPIYAGISIIDVSSSNFPQDYKITASFYENENTAVQEFNDENYYRLSDGIWKNIASIKTGYIYVIKNK